MGNYTHAHSDCSIYDELIYSGSLDPLYFEIGSQFEFPVFSPTDPNLFIYFTRDNESGVFDMRRKNIENQESMLLMSGFQLSSQPSWGNNDSIVFSDIDGAIKVVSSNGGEVETLFDDGFCVYPVYNSNSSEIFFLQLGEDSYPYKLLRMNTSSLEVDTLENVYRGYNALSNNNVLASKFYTLDGTAIGISNLNNLQVNYLTSPEFNIVGGLAWHPNNQSLYFTDVVKFGGLKVVNISSEQVEEVIPHCINKFFKSISISSDGSKMLAQTQINVPYSDENDIVSSFIDRYNKITLIDLISLDEKVLELD